VACFLLHNGFVPQKNFVIINVGQANKIRCSVSLNETSRPLKRKHILTVQEFQTRLSSEEQCWQYSTSLKAFLKAHVLPGSHVLTDVWRSYWSLEAEGSPTLRRGPDPAASHRLFPWVHMTLSNLKRFLLGTPHQAEPKPLKRYRAEFVYRLNRRTMEANLFQRLACACLATHTILDKGLIAPPDQA
jgi:hypothetical protein